MKKIGLFLLVSIFVLTGASVVVNAATEDTNPPTLKSVSIKNNKGEYEEGEKVYLNIDAYDDISGINTIRVHFFDKSTINDGQFNGNAGSADVFDFQSNPYFIVPKDIVNRSVEIWKVEFVDNAGNNIKYCNDKDYVDKYGDFDKNYPEKYLSYTMKFSSVPSSYDSVPPTLKYVSLSSKSVKYGDTLLIKGYTADDKSGIESVRLVFDYRVNGQSQGKGGFIAEGYPDAAGDFEIEYDVPAYNGDYVLYIVDVTDFNGNTTRYTDSISEGDKNYFQDVKLLSDVVKETLKFTVNNAPESNIEAIKVSKINYIYKKLKAPTTYKFGIQLNKDDPAIESITVNLKNKSEGNKYLAFTLYRDGKGSYSNYIDIDQFATKGVYALESVHLDLKPGYKDSTNDMEGIKFDKVDLFEIIEEKKYDVITSTTDKDLLTKIRTAKNGAHIAISSTNSSIISKEVFDAIKGTNKTIYLESHGIQWVFNGKDIKEIKDININTSVGYIYENNLKDKIGQYLDKSIVVNFADNGKLPGLALIRVKTDYALRNYLGVNNLEVYYYNTAEDKMFDMVASGVSLTEDGYIEFNINHNSSFVISNKKVDDKLISDNKEDLKLNDSNVTSVVKKVTSDNAENNVVLYSIIAGIIGLVLLFTVIILIKKHKKNKKAEV